MKITRTPAFVSHFGGQANLMAAALVCAVAFTTTVAQAADPSTPLPSAELRACGAGALPSWNEGKTKQAIVDFVKRVTTPGKDFVPEPERIATFDNDGTLWAEQPLYFQLAFALDRVKALALQHPE